MRSGVTHVLDLTESGPAVAWPGGVVAEHHRLVEYQAPEVETLEAVSAHAAALVSAGNTVLVHCREGIQRAPLVACATLIQQGWPLADAVKRVRKRRVIADLTEAQLNVLREFSASHGHPLPSGVSASA